MDFISNLVANINTYLSNYILIILLVSVGIYFTFATKFVQIRCFKEGLKRTFANFSLAGEKHVSGLSSFQSLATAIAAQVGTGNIVGACGAILVGGPGAIFWMWIIAFFGMATIYGEAVLAQKTRIVTEDGTVKGGPVYYITSVFKGKFGKFLAVFFAIAAMLALGFMGSMVQSNSIAQSCNTAFNIPTWVVGIIVSAICAFIFIGGVQRIGSVVEKIVPVMAILYIIGGIMVLGVNFKHIPETFGMIFKYAFNAKAALGGSIGAAIYVALTQGAKRGLFSNEAGMGSTPHAHAQANVAKPHDQGVCAMIGLFIDTFVVLTFTALIVISTFFTGDGALNPANFSAGTFLEQAAAENGLMNTNLAQKAFGIAFGNANIGNIFVAICLFFFAFSTIISWNLFGRINAIYLFGKKFDVVYSIIAIAFIFTGSILSNTLVWDLTDMFNNLMVIPNVIALFALGKVVKQISKTNKQNSLE
ncbi:MAG: sodium:alanine symporter family protein [Ruminococcaceae bacterium]|nr:sodium:alanine symporter family protein [Oscillospiraceae bacterium]